MLLDLINYMTWNLASEFYEFSSNKSDIFFIILYICDKNSKGLLSFFLSVFSNA